MIIPPNDKQKLLLRDFFVFKAHYTHSHMYNMKYIIYNMYDMWRDINTGRNIY